MPFHVWPNAAISSRLPSIMVHLLNNREIYDAKNLRVKVRAREGKFARSSLVVNSYVVKCRKHEREFKLVGTAGRGQGGEKQIRMNEAKITVMARFTITVIETEICESPDALTAETSLERPQAFVLQAPESFRTFSYKRVDIRNYPVFNFTTNFTLAFVFSCFTLRVLFSFDR